jgi:hypothetical protein
MSTSLKQFGIGELESGLEFLGVDLEPQADLEKILKRWTWTQK